MKRHTNKGIYIPSEISIRRKYNTDKYIYNRDICTEGYTYKRDINTGENNTYMDKHIHERIHIQTDTYKEIYTWGGEDIYGGSHIQKDTYMYKWIYIEEHIYREIYIQTDIYGGKIHIEEHIHRGNIHTREGNIYTDKYTYGEI